jgi:hypothetical protein
MPLAAWLGFFALEWYGPRVTTSADSAKKERVGLALGVAMAANQVAIISVPPMLGALYDHARGFGVVGDWRSVGCCLPAGPSSLPATRSSQADRLESQITPTSQRPSGRARLLRGPPFGRTSPRMRRERDGSLHRLAQKPNWAVPPGASVRFHSTPLAVSCCPATVYTAFQSCEIVPSIVSDIVQVSGALPPLEMFTLEQ